MFGKLLKYDFTHYLKLWTVGAATALIMAAVGGFCQSQSPWLYRTDRVFLGLMFTLITVVSVVSIIAFSLLSTVLVCMRYAKNCFSDEGYLTFTLPAKRSTIFNAKLTGGIIYYIMTLIITICAFAIFLGLASPRTLRDIVVGFRNLIIDGINFIGGYFWAYAAIAVLIFVLSCLFTIMMMYFCITFAGTRVRKNKVLAGVGIYYLFSTILGIVLQLFFFASVFIINARPRMIPEAIHEAMLVLLSVVVVWLIGGIAAFYYSQLNMLDKKLNLA